MASPDNKIFGIEDPNFTKANLYCHCIPEKEGKRRRGLIALRDLGEVNAILPVLNRTSKYLDLFVMASGRAEEDLLKSPIGFRKALHRDPMGRIIKLRGDITITGMSSSAPTLDTAMNVEAHKKDGTVVAIEDYPGGYHAALRRAFEMTDLARPDYLCVLSEWAKNENLSHMQGFNPDNILVTGQPAFDYTASEDRVTVRQEVNAKTGLTDEDFLIVWMGQTSPAHFESFRIFINGLREVDPVNYRFALRRHPTRDTQPVSDYEKLLQPISLRVVDTSSVSTPYVGVRADLVASMYSTEGLTSVMRGIPTIHVMVPELMAEAPDPGTKVPAVEDGASACVKKAEDMADVLSKVLFNEGYRHELQRRMAIWTPDGRSAERIASLILGLVR